MGVGNHTSGFGLEVDPGSYFCLADVLPQKHANASLLPFFSDSIAPLFLSVPPPPSLPLSLLVAINYTDSLTGWNKEIKHLNIVSWCMHSSPLPNTDIEEILHSCQLTKLYPRSRARGAQVPSGAAPLGPEPAPGRNPSLYFLLLHFLKQRTEFLHESWSFVHFLKAVRIQFNFLESLFFRGISLSSGKWNTKMPGSMFSSSHNQWGLLTF